MLGPRSQYGEPGARGVRRGRAGGAGQARARPAHLRGAGRPPFDEVRRLPASAVPRAGVRGAAHQAVHNLSHPRPNGPRYPVRGPLRVRPPARQQPPGEHEPGGCLVPAARHPEAVAAARLEDFHAPLWAFDPAAHAIGQLRFRLGLRGLVRLVVTRQPETRHQAVVVCPAHPQRTGDLADLLRDVRVRTPVEPDLADRRRDHAEATRGEAGVPVPTARRWIAEARRRDLLPPGRKGRAG